MQPFNSYFKSPDLNGRVLGLHPLCVLMMADMIVWATSRSLPAVITEAVTTEAEDNALKRSSSSHREQRAFDMSSRGWDENSINEFILFFTNKYRSIGAVGASGMPALIVHHDSGTGMHFHVQIHKRFLNPLTKGLT